MRLDNFFAVALGLALSATATVGQTQQQPAPAAESAAAGAFPAEAVLAAVVGVEATVPDSARTAATLGTERRGSGVIIDSAGLVVTVGYVILEAASAELVLDSGQRVPATVLAYDHNTGFGLLRAAQPLAIAPLKLGSARALQARDQVLAISHGGPSGVRAATVVSRRQFAGYWEYLLDDAIFISPPHPQFGGAALIGPDGTLLGIGSLVVNDTLGDASPVSLPGNMFIPIDQLEPILGDLLSQGRSTEPARPWLGIYAEEARGYLFISRVAEDGPAAQAGLAADEIIVRVAGEPVSSLGGFYQRLWSVGEAGVTVPLTVLRGGELTDINVVSGDRYNWLKLNPSF